MASILRGDNWVWSVYIVLLTISIVEIFVDTDQVAYKTDIVSRNSAISHTLSLMSGFFVILLLLLKNGRIFRAWDIPKYQICTLAIATGIAIMIAFWMRYGSIQQVEIATTDVAYSKYSYDIIVEDWGVVPALLIPLSYLALFIRCIVLSRRTKKTLVRLLIIGMPLIICMQALVHICVCVGAINMVEQPLPLISCSNSSIMFTSILFGMILVLSQIIQREQNARLIEKDHIEDMLLEI